MLCFSHFGTPAASTMILASLLLFSGCDDKSIVKVYNKKIAQTPITCIQLSVSPPDEMISQVLKAHYDFHNDCDLTLTISHKSGIKCNSSYNIATKTLSSFPTAFLKMELRRGMDLQYSYYIDLNQKADKEDIEKGWERIKEDIGIRR